jgi:hypothetical protein
MRQQGPHVGVAALANRAQPFLAAAGVLLGHQPEIGGQVPAGAEAADATDRHDQSGGRDRTHARDGRQPPCRRMLAGELAQLAVDLGQPALQVARELDQMLQLLADLRRQCLVARIFHQAHQLTGLADTLAADDAQLGQVPAQGVDLHGLLLDQQLPDPVQLGHGLLLDRLHRDKAHGRAGHRLADRLGIGGVMLVGFHVRFT